MPKKLKNLPLSPKLAPPEEIIVNTAKSARGIPAGWIIEPVAMQILRDCCVLYPYHTAHKEMTHYVRIEDAMSDEVLLERETYELVHEVLVRLGAKYVSSSRVHAWPYDPSELLEVLREEGTMPAKNPLEFFATPPAVLQEIRRRIDPEQIDHCRDLLYLQREHNYQIRILEPSAGLGAMAEIARELYPNALIHCCEVDPYRRQALEKKGFTVVAGDFLDYTPEEGYDLILMNPPFGSEKHGNAAYIVHIMHAHSILRDSESDLHTIASTGFLFTGTKVSSDFLTFCMTHGDIEVLGAGAFKDSGTGTNTAILWLGRDLLWPFNKSDEPHAGWPKAILWNLFLFFDNDSELDKKFWELQKKMVTNDLPVYTNGKPADKTRQAIITLFQQASLHFRKQRLHVPVYQEDYDFIVAHVLEKFEENYAYLVETVRREVPAWRPPQRPEPPEAASLLDLFDQLTPAGV